MDVEEKYYADDEDAYLMKKFFKETPESKNLAQKKDKEQPKEDKKEDAEEEGTENIEEGKGQPQNTQAAAAKKKKKRR